MVCLSNVIALLIFSSSRLLPHPVVVAAKVDSGVSGGCTGMAPLEAGLTSQFGAWLRFSALHLASNEVNCWRRLRQYSCSNFRVRRRLSTLFQQRSRTFLIGMRRP